MLFTYGIYESFRHVFISREIRAFFCFTSDKRQVVMRATDVTLPSFQGKTRNGCSKQLKGDGNETKLA